MSKERLNEIKEYFSYCIENGLAISEQEEKLLHEIYSELEKALDNQRCDICHII